MNKKIFFSIGNIAVIAAPITAVISCENKTKQETSVVNLYSSMELKQVREIKKTYHYSDYNKEGLFDKKGNNQYSKEGLFDKNGDNQYSVKGVYKLPVKIFSPQIKLKYTITLNNQSKDYPFYFVEMISAELSNASDLREIISAGISKNYWKSSSMWTGKGKDIFDNRLKNDMAKFTEDYLVNQLDSARIGVEKFIENRGLIGRAIMANSTKGTNIRFKKIKIDYFDENKFKKQFSELKDYILEMYSKENKFSNKYN